MSGCIKRAHGAAPFVRGRGLHGGGCGSRGGRARSADLQPGHSADHVGYVLPLPRSRQERAPGRHAPRHSRGSDQADARGTYSDRSRRSRQERDHQAGVRGRRDRHAAQGRAQGTDAGTEGHHSPLGRRRRGLRRPLGLSAGETSGGSRRRGRIAHREPDRSLHSGSASPRRADAGTQG